MEPSSVYWYCPSSSAAVLTALRPASGTVVAPLPKTVNVVTAVRTSGTAVAVSDAFSVG